VREAKWGEKDPRRAHSEHCPRPSASGEKGGKIRLSAEKKRDLSKRGESPARIGKSLILPRVKGRSEAFYRE